MKHHQCITCKQEGFFFTLTSSQRVLTRRYSETQKRRNANAFSQQPLSPVVRRFFPQEAEAAMVTGAASRCNQRAKATMILQGNLHMSIPKGQSHNGAAMEPPPYSRYPVRQMRPNNSRPSTSLVVSMPDIHPNKRFGVGILNIYLCVVRCTVDAQDLAHHASNMTAKHL